MEQNSKSEMQRLVLWICENLEDWELICGVTGMEIEKQRLCDILDSLIACSLYQTALVAITACSNGITVAKAIKKILCFNMYDKWDSHLLKGVICDINQELKQLK